MATIGGLSGNTSSGINMYGTSIKGYGGLASGLDTDSLIQGMTQGTRLQITQLMKKKTLNQWQTDLYRSISDKLVAFQTKYLEATGSNSLLRAGFFEKTVAEINGANNGAISVSGSVKNLENLKVVGVGQLAKDTSLITNGSASGQTLKTGELDFSADATHKESNLEKETLTFTYGTQKYTITLKSGQTVKAADGTEFTTDFTTMGEGGVVDSINGLLRGVSLGEGGGTLADKVEFSVDDSGKFAITSKDTAGNTVELKDISSVAEKLLGFKSDTSISATDDKKITGNTAADIDKEGEDGLYKDVSTWDGLAGKTITFDYNGTSKKITMPSAEDLKKWKDAGGDTLKTELTKAVQDQFDTAFGKGRIKVESEGTDEKFSFSIKTSDKSSVLKVTAGDAGMVGKDSIMGLNIGSSNRFRMDAKLSESGFAFGAKDDDGNYAVTDYNDEKGNLLLSINGKKIEGLTVDSTMADVMRAINSSDAGVKVNYLETSDVFSVTSTIHGAAGRIEMGNDFGSLMFGEAGKDYTINQGQDAMMVVEYEGGVQGTITRDTNSFNFEGATFTLKSTFGLKADDTKKAELDEAAYNTLSDADKSLYVQNTTSGKYEIDASKLNDYTLNAKGEYVKFSETAGANGEDQKLTFTTSVNKDKITEAVKDMVKDYNELVKLVNDTLTQRPNRGYGPLSDEEKEGLSESEIKSLEDKAKEGILFGDSQLRSLSDRLRTVFSGAANAQVLKDMGLTISSSYKENGKIDFDEEKFKAALEEDPDAVKNLFTRPSTTGADGITTDRGGISVRLKSITYDFANIMGTKGSLIKKAGSSFSALSELDNEMLKVRNTIDNQISTLQKKLQTEIDRYSRQFTSLETLISQMNSQSSYLAQLGGGF